MRSLETRLARLEQQAEALDGNAKGVPVIFIITGVQGVEATVALLPGGRTIERERDESEADFIERVYRHVSDCGSDSSR